MRAHGAAGEVGGDPGAPQRLLHQRQVGPRIAQQNRHRVERLAVKSQVADAARDLHAFASLARRGDEDDALVVLQGLCLTLPGGGEVESEDVAPQPLEAPRGRPFGGRLGPGREDLFEGRERFGVALGHRGQGLRGPADEGGEKAPLGHRGGRQIEGQKRQTEQIVLGRLALRARQLEDQGVVGQRPAPELLAVGVEEAGEVGARRARGGEIPAVDVVGSELAQGGGQRARQARRLGHRLEVGQGAGVVAAGDRARRQGLDAEGADRRQPPLGHRPRREIRGQLQGRGAVDAEEPGALFAGAAQQVVGGAPRRRQDEDLARRRGRGDEPVAGLGEAPGGAGREQ